MPVGEFLRRREGRASVLGVLVYGLLLGYVGWYTFFEPVAATYPVKWDASWVALSDENISQSYFRKKLHLGQSVRHAWVQVLATESFQFYLNGRVVGAAYRLADNVTGVFDLTTALRPGTNVFALTTHRSTPGPSKVAIEGVYESWQGVRHRVVSDATWKAAPYFEWQLSGGPQWFESDFNDSQWVYAKVIGVPAPQDNSKVAFDPLMYTERVRGQWMWASSAEAPRAFLRTRIDLAAPPREAWIRVAGQGYHLMVNGIVIGEKTQSLGVAGVPLIGQSLSLYRITPFLRRGENTFALSGVAERADRAILVDGLIVGADGRALWLASPDGWRASTVENPGWARAGFDDASWTTPLARGLLPSADALAKDLAAPTPPDDYRLAQALRGLAVLFGSVAAVGLLWLASAGLFAALRGVSIGWSLVVTAALFPLPTLLLIVALLLGYDLRYDPAFPFQEQFIVWDLLVYGLAFLVALVPWPSASRPVQPRDVKV